VAGGPDGRPTAPIVEQGRDEAAPSPDAGTIDALIDARLGWAAGPDGFTWMSGPKSNVEAPTMKRFRRFRLRLGLLVWLVAVVAAALGGVRYWQDRAETRAEALYRHLVSSPAGADDFFANSKVVARSIG
jgi:hypothetical protein